MTKSRVGPWQKIKLEAGNVGAVIEAVGLGLKRSPAYLWIGDEHRCFGVIPDAQIEKLRDWCNTIIADRKEQRPKKATKP